MSTTERLISTNPTINAALKDMLVNNEPFQYAHLIKFERPSRPDSLSGLVSTAAKRYIYLTDASINVDFDDGSTDSFGVANLSQTYLANKVLSVGAIQEQTKATTSSTSVVLDGNALGGSIVCDITIATAGLDSTSTPLYDITIGAPFNTDDLLAEGFREGDKITLNISSTDIKVNIVSFRTNNVLRVKKIDTDLSPYFGSVAGCPISLASEEIISILLNKNDLEYASFINREVYIYRAYFQNGAIVGVPILLFKGIIQNVSFEDSESAIKVTWGLGSHWGDFAEVKGRITSDSSHRALDANGVAQPKSALKPIYAYDKGFNHAELSLNLLSKYTVMVEKIDVSSKKGFLGIGASVKTKKQMVPEDRNTVLDFQLNAKAIPVIYGVRTAEGIPIFADTLNNDSSTVYVAVALSEGEIGGIYDLYIEGKSLICNDITDANARSANGQYTDVNGATVSRSTDQQNSIQLTCIGRANQGDVLKGEYALGSAYPFFLRSDYLSGNRGEYQSLYPTNFNYLSNWFINQYIRPSNLSTASTYGVLHEESISMTTPHDFTLDVFTGRPGQRASAQLCKEAFDKNFKIQNSYWSGKDTSEYWGPNHKLCDTAYIVGRYKISADETTIPEIKFVVRGKVVDCYNYDYSYLHDDRAGTPLTVTSTTVTVTNGNMSFTLPAGHGLSTGKIVSFTASNYILSFLDKTITISGNTLTVPTTLPNGSYSAITGTITIPESADNFALGETGITLKRTDTNAVIANGVQIIDKWTFMNPDGTSNTRFRFDVDPVIGSAKSIYMEDSSGNKWTMLTHDYNIFGAAYSDTTNRKQVTTPIQSSLSTNGVTPSTNAITLDSASTNFAINYVSNTNMTIENDPVDASAKFQIVQSDYTPLSTGTIFTSGIFVANSLNTSTKLVTGYNYADNLSEINALNGIADLKLVSKNTIKLPTGASTINDYYKGYFIEVTRVNTSTGKVSTQVAEIIGYTGGTINIATISTIWDFIPGSADGTIEKDYVRIYHKYADGRISINPAIQLLDYVKSKTYGRGLDVTKDIDLDSWRLTARKCDTRSDVTLLYTGGTPVVGEKYSYSSGSTLIWQGEVSAVTSVTVSGTPKSLVTFTNNIGKLTNKWNSWKSWKVGDIIYNPETYQFFTVTPAGAGVITTNPTASTTAVTLMGSSFNITKVGASSTTITVPLTEGNPIQAWRNGNKNSGYSLYDSDDVDYWRLSGWDEHSQRYVTRNQCNITIDTSLSVFDNVNSLLEHFNGILRYTAGKYYLDVEELADVIENPEIRRITTDDIIGKIQLSDEGTRSSFNSLTAAFADPSNKFEPRNVSFFNSDYLKIDKNVPKKGNLSVPGITNYYNTRLLADSFLNKSRFGLTISMTVRYHGIMLLAGSIIEVVYPRYGGTWTSGKKFRIESLNYQPDGLVDIVAKEYDDSFYGLTNIRKTAGSTNSPTTGTGTPVGAVGIQPPTGITATQNKYNQIEVTWTNSSDILSTYVEIWRADSTAFGGAVLLDTIPATGTTQTYTDKFVPDPGTGSSITKYYWVRYKVIK